MSTWPPHGRTRAEHREAETTELDAQDAWTPGPHNRPLPTEGPLADALHRYREARHG